MRIPFRIGDALVYLFILLLIAASFAGLYQMGRGVVNNQVTVEVDGEIWGTYNIPAKGDERVVRIDAGDNRYNIMIIADSGVLIREANCPDQICVNWGNISRPGQTIVCLPHKVVISITGEQEGELPLDDIAS
ncbi:MAG TPA: NusG domain II-containing protein [Clostridiales bacterium]|nr:NusG domain II-containing protein [Clostridiales bacterium]